MKFKINLFLLSFFFMPSLLALDLYSFSSAKDKARFNELTREIRCVVCQNQNIADSYAPLAKDLRQKVYDMVVANKTDAEIKYYLTNRYGDFILLKPRLNLSTALLWLFPLIALLFVLLIFIKTKKPYIEAK